AFSKPCYHLLANLDPKGGEPHAAESANKSAHSARTDVKMSCPGYIESSLQPLVFDDLPSEIGIAHRHLLPDAKSARFKRSIQRGGPRARLDYDRYFIEFNRAFFIRNYLKCISYLRALPERLDLKDQFVLDIGGGAGPFSLAALHYEPSTKAKVLDKSQAQVSLGRKLSSIGLGHIFSYEIVDVFNTNIALDSPRLLCYWTCENIRNLNLSGRTVLSG